MPEASTTRVWRERAVDTANRAGAWLLHHLERRLLRSSLVPTTAFLPTSVFPWVEELEAHWTTIRSELDEVLAYRDSLPNFQDISVDQASITNDDGWKTFFFFGYGFRSDANCDRCPKTAALLEAVPGLTTAFFSILSPGKRIPPHRGPWRGVLRYHLALQVPEPASGAGTGRRDAACCSTTATAMRRGTTRLAPGWSSSWTSCGPCVPWPPS
jgi:aspartyl/asparaginyl beta-hydroxylase (cupin superfamily)